MPITKGKVRYKMTNIDYATRAHNAGLNVYFVAEGDRDMNIRRMVVNPANPCCNGYSIAKAYTVLAVGLLYDRGLLTPESRALSFIPELVPDGIDERWYDVTLDHLMLHTAGFGRGLLDIDADDASAYPTQDYLNIVLTEPLPNVPGSKYQYTDAAFYLLSRVIAQVAGCDLADVLRPVLMGKLNFKEYAWSVCPQGYSMGATGLYTRTEDVLKLAILYLRGGDWNGEQILSREWVDLVLSRGYEFKPKGGGWYGKGGMRGQMLTFNPEKGLAVAWHAYGKIPFEAMIV